MTPARRAPVRRMAADGTTFQLQRDPRS